MFVYEKVPETDEDFYKKLFKTKYYHASWCVDREKSIYIDCIGKCGVETPVFFHMNYKSHYFRFYIDAPWLGNAPGLQVRIEKADELAEFEDDIVENIKLAFRTVPELSRYDGLTGPLDDYDFGFTEEGFLFYHSRRGTD